MENNLVSIITPVYNAERFIQPTINSVQNQTYSNWELLLIDDCSTDMSKEIIESCVQFDSRIKYFRLENNMGAAYTRNFGIKNAKGRYIAFIDSDDLWETNKLDLQLEFMKKFSYPFTFTSYRLIDEKGNNMNKVIKAPEVVDYNYLLKNTIIGCSTVVIDRELNGDFRMPLVRKGQDTATWLSILKNGKKAHGLNVTLASYRKVNGSISSNKMGALKRTWYLYRHIEKLSIFKSCYVFIFYILNAIKKRI